MTETERDAAGDARYSSGRLCRRLLALAWRFRADCLWSVGLSVLLVLFSIVGLKLAGGGD